jgi:hypothetical protein
MVVYAALRNLAQATIKPLWFDELLTEVLSRKSGLSALWTALKTAVDGNPPPFYLIERAAAALPINEHIAYRLPSILAFSATLICLYFFVERRSGPLTGLLCASLVLMTPLYNYYADEARPYSMMIACLAFALVCYQRVPAVSWTMGLFASLFLAMSLHYYAVLAFLPFFAAELLFALSSRRWRLLVWAALLLALIPLIVFRSFLVAVKAYYGSHLWSRPQFMEVLRSYGTFFRVETPWGFALAGLSVAAVLLALLQLGPRTELAEGREPSPLHEHVLVLGFIGFPMIVFLFAKLTHGGAVPRYYLCGILGVAIALRYVLDWLPPRASLICGAFLLLAIGTEEFSFWSTLRLNSGAPTAPAKSLLAFVDSVHRDDLPLVLSDAMGYFELQHYASPELQRRMVTLIDPPTADHYVGTDSVDKVMLALRQVTPLNVVDFPEFTASHRSFLLYSNGSPYEWVLTRFVQHGDALRILAAQGRASLYLVELKPDAN